MESKYFQTCSNNTNINNCTNERMEQKNSNNSELRIKSDQNKNQKKDNFNLETLQKLSNNLMVNSKKITEIHTISKELLQYRSMEVRHGIKQFYFCRQQQIAVLVNSDQIQIIDTILGETVNIIKNLAYPRFLRLQKNGRFMVVYYSDNTVRIMNLQGKVLSYVLGVPHSSTVFLISDNSQKLLYGNNQTICIWNIHQSYIQILTKQWKNINCYAISQDGKQFALGTYNGSIFVLTLIGNQKCTQFQIKRHKSCVMCLTYHKKNIVSVSYDKMYLQSLIETNQRGEKIISYTSHILQDIPRELIVDSSTVYMIFLSGMYWYTKDNKLLGFSHGNWSVFENQFKESIFVVNENGMIRWKKYVQTLVKIQKGT